VTQGAHKGLLSQKGHQISIGDRLHDMLPEECRLLQIMPKKKQWVKLQLNKNEGSGK
jgi:hypothetical protein